MSTKKYVKLIRRFQIDELKPKLRKFKKEINKFFRKQMFFYIDNIKIKKISLKEIDEKMLAIWQAWLLDVYFSWVEEARNQIKIESWFNIKDKNAEKWAKTNAWINLKKVNQTTEKKINNIIQEWIEKWKDKNQIAKEIKTEFTNFSQYRSELIAINELWTAYEQGKKEQAQEFEKRSKTKMYKNWVSHRDAKTTQPCLHNDTKENPKTKNWIRINQDFSSWNSKPPRFPWCRCFLKYASEDSLKIQWIL